MLRMNENGKRSSMKCFFGIARSNVIWKSQYQRCVLFCSEVKNSKLWSIVDRQDPNQNCVLGITTFSVISKYYHSIFSVEVLIRCVQQVDILSQTVSIVSKISCLVYWDYTQYSLRVIASNCCSIGSRHNSKCDWRG